MIQITQFWIGYAKLKAYIISIYMQNIGVQETRKCRCWDYQWDVETIDHYLFRFKTLFSLKERHENITIPTDRHDPKHMFKLMGKEINAILGAQTNL